MDPTTGGDFAGREREINAPTLVEQDAQSTFAIDVDTAAYSIARRTLIADRMPTASLVRVEEMINYFEYDYERPQGDRHPFSIEAEGAKSPVDGSKHIFRVGIQARVVEDADRLPANIVFLVDTSCSMTSGDKLELAKKSLKIAVDNLGEKDRVAITTYAGGVRVLLPPTPASDKKTIKRVIDGLQPGGGTAMESGLTLAYKQAAKMLRDNTITRIIVCSDGDANIGATTPEEMLKQVEGYVKEGVTLSTIGFGDGNYKDATMETIANKGNGNYYYIDTPRMAERVFGRDLTKMIQDVAQDVKIQVEFDKDAVHSYRLVGYENRDIADRDFRNDKVDAGEIGAGHQVTALYELTLNRGAQGKIATVRVRAKEPRGMTAKEAAFDVPVALVDRPFEAAPEDLRFATAVMGGSELLRQSPHARGWTFTRVMSLVSDVHLSDPDRTEFMELMKKAALLTGESQPLSAR
jgi:Ca-activated chloride channel family protein